MAYFQSLGDKCNLCLDHCWYRPLKLFLDGVTPRRFSTASSMSDSHKAASLYVLMLPIFHSQKRNSFCTYLFLPHGSLLCEKTLSMLELSKWFYIFPRKFFLLQSNIPSPLIIWSGPLFTVWLKEEMTKAR